MYNENDLDLLDKIYLNSKMGEQSTNKLIDIVSDAKLIKHLIIQNLEYDNINKASEKLLNSQGECATEHPLLNLYACTTIRLKTIKDRGPRHIAEMMLQGSMMGIIEATKNIKDYPYASEEILNLNQKLLNTEESNIEHLKAFL